MSLRGIKGRLAKVEARIPPPLVEIEITRTLVEPSREPGGKPIKVGELRRKARVPANVADAIERRNKEFVEGVEPTPVGDHGGDER